jgi:hypothetical protein
MKLNKKGLDVFGIASLIFVFFVMSVIMIGGAGFIFEIGDDYALAPLTNITEQFNSDDRISDDMVTGIASWRQMYNDINFMPDIYFLAMFLSMFTLTMYASIKSRKMGWISFTGFMTLGSMGFLFIVSIVAQLVAFFYDLFFVRLLERWTYNTPIFDNFINHMGLWAFIWFVLILIVNQVEFGRTDEDLVRGGLEEE